MKHILPLTLTALFFLTACGAGGGSRRLDPRQYCSTSVPIPMKMRNHKQLPLEVENLPEGEYRLLESTFFLIDPVNAIDPKEPILVHVSEAPNKKGELVPSAKCARNLKPNLEMEHATVGISKMDVDELGKFTMEMREFRIRIDKLGYKKTFVSKGSSNEKPSKVFEGKADAQTEVLLFRSSDGKNYEIRSHDRFPDGTEYYLATRFVKEKRKATPTP